MIVAQSGQSGKSALSKHRKEKRDFKRRKSPEGQVRSHLINKSGAETKGQRSGATIIMIIIIASGKGGGEPSGHQITRKRQHFS